MDSTLVINRERPAVGHSSDSTGNAAAMSYKTILVHAEAAPYADERIGLAVEIADLFDAGLVGLGAEAFDPILTSGDAMADGAMMQAVRARIDTDLPAAETRFRELTEASGRPVRWVSAVNYPAKELARHACGADLIVASRVRRQAKPAFAADPVDLVLQAGVPVLFAPDHNGAFRGDRIVVGWKNTREARRALADALPFMIRASEVVVVAIAAETEVKTRQAELEEVAQRLVRHGVNVRTEVVAKQAAGAAEDLERAAARHGADLIVIGAYGHSRMREWALGGMTEDLLAASSKFVLFSH